MAPRSTAGSGSRSVTRLTARAEEAPTMPSPAPSIAKAAVVVAEMLRRVALAAPVAVSVRISADDWTG